MSGKEITIIQKENLILRKKAAEVDFKKIDQSVLTKTLEDMKQALDSQEDGVAIAAPQIGVSLRMFVISKKVFEIYKTAEKNPNLIFINPKITKTSKKKHIVEEGCLSVRWLYGEVSRAQQVTVEAYNERGEKFKMGASGLLAQIFQHEIDHLEGILFIDKAKNLEEVPPEKKVAAKI